MHKQRETSYTYNVLSFSGVKHKILSPEPEYQIGHKIALGKLGFLAPNSQFLGART